jgi:malate synthase
MATNPAVNPTSGIDIRGAMQPGYDSILTPAAVEFVADLTRRFGDRVTALLDARVARQRELDGGALPDFLPQTRSVREGDWRVTSIPADLQDRRVENHQCAQLRRESLHGGL